MNHAACWVGARGAAALDHAGPQPRQRGIEPEPLEYPGGPAGLAACWVTDRDGYRIEAIQPNGMPTASPRPTLSEPVALAEGPPRGEDSHVGEDHGLIV